MTLVYVVSCQVVLRHFLLRREEVLSQCQAWQVTLAEGIEKMQARGVATAHLKDYLRKLVKNVETLKIEIGKIEKKLSQTQTVSDTTETSCLPEGSEANLETATAPSGSHPDRQTSPHSTSVNTTEQLHAEDTGAGQNIDEGLRTKSSHGCVGSPQPAGPSTTVPTTEEVGECRETNIRSEEGESPAAPTQHSCMSTDLQCGPQDHEQ